MCAEPLSHSVQILRIPDETLLWFTTRLAFLLTGIAPALPTATAATTLPSRVGHGSLATGEPHDEQTGCRRDKNRTNQVSKRSCCCCRWRLRRVFLTYTSFFHVKSDRTRWEQRAPALVTFDDD